MAWALFPGSQSKKFVIGVTARRDDVNKQSFGGQEQYPLVRLS
jgi:hypothetical protein